MARFFAAMRLLRRTLGDRLWLFAARRLNAAQCAAQFFNLAFIGQLLALGDLHEFQHFIQMIQQMLERLGNLRGVFHCLADGGSFGGTKI